MSDASGAGAVPEPGSPSGSVSGRRRVVLCTGHMVDRPGRSERRFPPEAEGLVAVRLFETLEELGAGAGDVGLCGGAAGADLLFAEACLGRGMELELLLPQDEEPFLAASVDPCGTGWRERYMAVARHDGVRTETMPSDVGDPDEGLYVRHKRWLVERALARGVEHLDVIAVWDGRSGDGSGGTADVVAAVREHTGRVRVIRPVG